MDNKFIIISEYSIQKCCNGVLSTWHRVVFCLRFLWWVTIVCICGSPLCMGVRIKEITGNYPKPSGDRRLAQGYRELDLWLCRLSRWGYCCRCRSSCMESCALRKYLEKWKISNKLIIEKKITRKTLCCKGRKWKRGVLRI